MKRKKRLMSCALLILGVVVMIPHTTKGYEEEQENYFETQSGIPDVVNSATSNTTHHLTVVANSDRIEDKEEFARTVIHMCQDNSFHTIKFSTDHGYPSELDIDVFLSIEDFESRNEPIYEIQFKTDNYNENYNIKDHVEEYHLYVNNEEIEFF